MEFEEFKNIWNQHAERDSQTESIQKYANKTNMTVTSTFHNLTNTTLYWWNFTKKVIVLLFLALALNIGVNMFIPENYENLYNTLPGLGIIALFAVFTLWLYYEKTKIFEVSDSDTIKSTITKTVNKFKRWYTLCMIFCLFTFPVVFFVSIKFFLQPFKILLPLHTTVIIACAVSTLCLVGSHIYYKKTYFKWLTALQHSMKELDEKK